MGSLSSNPSDRPSATFDGLDLDYEEPETYDHRDYYDRDYYDEDEVDEYGMLYPDPFDFYYDDIEECVHGNLYEDCLHCQWDAYEDGLEPGIEVIDSAGFLYRVKVSAQADYLRYKGTGLLPDEPADDSGLDFYRDDPWSFGYYELFESICRHGELIEDGCLNCDFDAYDEYLGLRPVSDDLRVPDPFRHERVTHDRRKLRRAARRGKTIARHRRHVAQAKVRISVGTFPDSKYSSSRSLRYEWLTDKPWQSRFRRFDRDYWVDQENANKRERRKHGIRSDELAWED